jgi:chemotaxis protein CheX
MRRAIHSQLSQTEMATILNQATSEVCSTMLGRDVSSLEPFIERTAILPSFGIVSLVGLTGACVGTVAVSCAPELACQFASHVLMTNYETVNEDVLDAIAEITKMIGGHLKPLLEEYVGSLALSVPTVVFGTDLQARIAASYSWVVVPFACDGHNLHVRLGLRPNESESWRAGRSYAIPQLLSA